MANIGMKTRGVKMAKKNEPESIEVKLVVDTIQDVPTFYVNHAEIAVGPHECAIWFTRVPTKPSRDDFEAIKETKEYAVEPEVQLLLPHSMIEGLIGALQKVQTNMKDSNDASA